MEEKKDNKDNVKQKPFGFKGFKSGKKISLEELLVFTKGLSSLIHTGEKFNKALNLLEMRTRNKELKKVIHELHNDIFFNNYKIDTAFKKHSEVFPKFYILILGNDPKINMMPGLLQRIIEEFPEQMAIEKAKEFKDSEIHFSRNVVTQKDLAVFTKSLATMINCGLQLTSSLQILEKQSDNKYFATIIHSISNDIIMNGARFSVAIKKFPKIFSNSYVVMIEAGEKIGKIHIVLERLAEVLEKQLSLTSKTYAALTYPAIAVCFTGLIVIAIVKFVLPGFIPMITSLKTEIPLPTKILFTVVDFIKNPVNLLIIIAVFVVVVFLFRTYYKTEKGKLNIDENILKIPVFGMFFTKVAAYKLSYMISLATSAGLDFKHLSRLMVDSADNGYVKANLADFIRKVKLGDPIDKAINETTVLPKTFRILWSTGYQTGKVSHSMKTLERLYENEIETTLDTLTDLVEPFLIIFLGIVVGGILMAVLMPIYSIMMSLGQ